MIPYGRQEVTTADIEAVTAILKSDFLTQGPAVPRFEQAIADYCGVRHALAVNSATSGLHIACLALDLGPGDILWTTPITFVASANCALYCGAKVDFVDIDPATCNMSVASLRIKLEAAQKAGCLPKIVVPVHFTGQSCDMRTIHALGKEYGFHIIEDAAHAIGGKYEGTPIGDCRYSDITVFSFHPVKIITTGEGGMTVTNNNELAMKMEILRSHGITRNKSLFKRDSDGPWCYQQIALGFNYRMTDIQAALGLSQLDRLDAYVARRHELAKRYNDLLCRLPLILPVFDHAAFSAMHLYTIQLKDSALISRKDMFAKLRAEEIGVNVHYIPVHTQPYYEAMGFSPGDFPNAEAYYGSAITLPLYATLTNPQQDLVVEAVRKGLEL